MAKKVKNSKLLRQSNNNGSINQLPSNQKSGQNKSVFNSFAEKIHIAKQKRIEKLSDTKNRIMSKKKENKIMRVPTQFSKGNKFNKFALLDDADQEPTHKLTHKGATLDKVKHFNDMHFDNDAMNDDSANFDEMHGQMNFHGFEEENDGRQENDDQRRKSKN